MQSKRPPIQFIVIPIVLLGLISYFIYTQIVEANDTSLRASGTVETVEIKIAPEIGGKVLSVEVEQGQSVHQGDVLFKLDPTLLNAQLDAAKSALATAKAASATAQAAAETAKAQYNLAVVTALNEEQTARTADWRVSTSGDLTQPAWYFTRTEQMTALEAEVTAAEKALEQAEKKLKTVESQIVDTDFAAAEIKLQQMRMAYDAAKAVLDRTSSGSQELRDAAQTAFDDAKADLDDAQKDYDDLLSTDNAQDVLEARADLRVAQERLSTAQDTLRQLQTGLLSPKVLAAEKALNQALAAADQADVAIQQAAAQVSLVEAQLAKLTVKAPSDGVILARNIEPGEFVSPGAVAVSLARLSELTITVFVPENRYGEVTLGQQVKVSVDSFPGEEFTATVIHIADRAEFTPRNVQTDEGRATTVYAIKLKLDDPNGKLKPGMPADVLFIP